MSEIKANVISNLAGTGPSDLTGQWAPRVVWRINQLSPAVNLDLNVSSVTDSATGQFLVTYSNAFVSATAQSVVCATDEISATTSIITINPRQNLIATTNTQFETARANATDNRTDLDMSHNSGHHHGELA